MLTKQSEVAVNGVQQLLLRTEVGYRDALISEYHKYPALIPVFDFMDDKAPGKVRKMKGMDGRWLYPFFGQLEKLIQRWIRQFNM